MTSKNKSINVTFRSLGLVVVLMLGTLSILGTNTDDDEGSNGGTSAGLLSTYDISISRGVDTNGDESNGITINVPLGGPNLMVRVDPHPVLGTFQCDPETEECGLSTIDTGMFLDVFDESSAQIVGDLQIQILEQVIIGVSGLPVIGSFQVASLPAPDGLDEGYIKVEMATCTEGAGVNIYDNGVQKGCYIWSDFEQLFDTSSDPVEQLAAFGYQVIDFLFGQMEFVTEILGVIDNNAATLQQAGSIDEMCDAFSTAGLTPPRNVMGRMVPDQGMRSLSWIDTNPDGSLGPGDDFVGTLQECWFNNPADDVDELLDGTGNFLDYVKNVDTKREVITAIGFTSVGSSLPGGVFYNGFTISETQETTPGTAEITNVIGVEGGVSVMFTEPQ